MSKNDIPLLSSISGARTDDEMAEFWDTHSLADYWDQTREVQFDVRAARRRRVTMETDLYERVEIWARQRGLMPETLVNLWVAERLELQQAQ
ncbi:MAG: BrnA antitoxin family protein [Caldilineales bacterium]|nr:BrnA antitoxin family protein [Caldilineales bacterium]